MGIYFSKGQKTFCASKLRNGNKTSQPKITEIKYNLVVRFK